MLHKYQQWLEESEKMEAAAVEATPTEAPATDTTAIATPIDEPAAEAPAATDTATDAATETPAPEEASADSEIEQFRELDEKRKEAIKAFKKKQEEFLQIPDDIRKNPVEEEDKAKVEELKTELISLNKEMKDAVKAWEEFNDNMLGFEDETAPDYEP